MSGALGTLVVEVAANVARFQSDMGKVAQIAQSNAQQIQKAVDLVGNSLKALGAGFVIGLTFDKAKAQIEGVIKSAAGLQELAERTGGTVETLSGLSSIAKLSGTDAEALAGGIQKLSKAMIDAQGGGKTTTAAFESLGLSLSDIKGLKPDEVFARIAQAQAGYADGAEKVAVMQALLGKSGANLLPVMKDLAEAGDLQAKVSGRQAEMADQYEKTLVRLQAAQGGIWKRIAFEVLPAMNAFAETMLESAKSTGGLNGAVDALAKNNTLRDWAQGIAIALATVIESMTLLIKAAGAVAGSFQAVWADLKLVAVFDPIRMVKAAWSDEARKELTQALDERNKTVEAANKRYVDLWNYDATALSRGLREKFAVTNAGAGAGRGVVNPAAAVRMTAPAFNPGSEDANKAGQSFLEGLQRQLEQQTRNRFEALRMEAAQKGVAKQAEVLIQKLEEVHRQQQRVTQAAEMAAVAAKRQTDYENAYGAVNRAGGEKYVDLIREAEALSMTADQIERVAMLRKFDEDTQKQLIGLTGDEAAAVVALAERLRSDLITAYDDLAQRRRAFNTGSDKAFRDYAEQAGNQAKRAEDLVKGSLERLEDALVNFAKTGKLSFSNLFSFMAEEYIRAQIRMSIADFLPGGKGLGGTSLLATGFSWFKGLLGFANGLPYVPYDNFPAVLHEGERVITKAENMAGGAGGASLSIGAGQTINVGSNVSRSEVASALKQSQEQTLQRVRRLMQQGRLV